MCVCAALEVSKRPSNRLMHGDGEPSLVDEVPDALGMPTLQGAGDVHPSHASPPEMEGVMGP